MGFLQMSVFSIIGAALVVLVSIGIDSLIASLDDMLVPCQHGTPYVNGRCSCIDTPFSGVYCGECACEHGTCMLGGTTPKITSDYGCRCPLRTKRFGFLCDQCFTQDNETCNGECLDGFTGALCERTCFSNISYVDTASNNVTGDAKVCRDLRIAGGTCNLCSGHGICNNGMCDCNENWFNHGLLQCSRTCPKNEKGICSGHGSCKLFGDTPGCLCSFGWRGPECEIMCPGMDINDKACNGHGNCMVDFLTNEATCDCNQKFRGEACGIECPGDIIACGGHGTCGDNGSCICYASTVGWQGRSCNCSSLVSCSGNGVCNGDQCVCEGNYAGHNCGKCKKHYWGSKCQFYCNPAGGKTDFGCHSRGQCVVDNMGTERVVCVCDSKRVTIFDGESRNTYEASYSNVDNCGSCEAGFLPSIDLAEEYTLPVGVHIECQVFCFGLTCNEQGSCNVNYGKPGESLCRCSTGSLKNRHLDDNSFCTKCQENWFPEDVQSDGGCINYCVAKLDGSFPSECSHGNIECIQCSGNGVCGPDGQCLCNDGYTGDSCQIHCTGVDGKICSGHGKCIATPMQELLQHELAGTTSVLYYCECDPQDTYTDAERTEYKEAVARNETTGALDPPPEKEYFGEMCSSYCLKPPWLSAERCNDLGECKTFPIETPVGGIFQCTSDEYCKNKDEIIQIISAESKWGTHKGPFCNKPNIPRECTTSTFTNDNCIEILTLQRPPVTRSQACVGSSACKTAMDSMNWDNWCTTVLTVETPSEFANCPLVIDTFCPAATLPSKCLNYVHLTSGDDVSGHLDYCYENSKKDFPFEITDAYRWTQGVLMHDKVSHEFEKLSTKYPSLNMNSSEYCENRLKKTQVTSHAENKRYLCNGVFTNSSECSTELLDLGDAWTPFVVRCFNQPDILFTELKDAINSRGVGCEVIENEDRSDFMLNTFDMVEAVNLIDDTCSNGVSHFPTCKAPSNACEINICKDGDSCIMEGGIATCHTTGILKCECNHNFTCQALTFSSYKCIGNFKASLCPDKEREFNWIEYCKDNNPIIDTMVSPQIGSTVEFTVKADKLKTSASLSAMHFNETIFRFFLHQGQIQINEPILLESCPIDNPTCLDTWSYEPDEWYSIRISINWDQQQLTMYKGEDSKSFSFLAPFEGITEFKIETGVASTQYENLVYTKDMPKPSIYDDCSEYYCNIDVDYRSLCKDVLINLKYPSLLEPQKNIINTCSEHFEYEKFVGMHSVSEVEGTPDMSISETECNVYANSIGLTVALTTPELAPRGCILWDGSILWSGRIPQTEDECRQWAVQTTGKYPGDDGGKDVFEGSWSHIPNGCATSIGGKTHWNIGEGSGNCNAGGYKCITGGDCGSNLHVKFTSLGTYDTSISEARCNELATNAGTVLAASGNWKDHPRGCFRHMSSNTWYFKTGSNGNDGCETLTSYYCVKYINNKCIQKSNVGSILDEMEKLDWDTYCAFAASINDTRPCSVTHQYLEDYDPCRVFIDPIDGVKQCIVDALETNWETKCKEIEDAYIPVEITSKCSEECYSSLKKYDKCDVRKQVFSSNTDISSSISGCDVDWVAHCMDVARGDNSGVCSAIECNCHANEGMSGEACELHCAMGADGTPCGEGKGIGICVPTEKEKAIISAGIKNEEGDYIAYNGQMIQIEGECQCFLSDGKDNCDQECKSCDNSTYNEKYTRAFCDVGKALCQCLPPYTEIQLQTYITWKGDHRTKVNRKYDLPSLSDDEIKRIRMMQGRETFIREYLVPNSTRSDWIFHYDKFRDNPGDFTCGNVECDNSDFILLGNMEHTSWLYNYDCKKECPGVNATTKIPCSGHGRCGVTGTCICDMAKVIKGTDGDTGSSFTINIFEGESLTDAKNLVSKLDQSGWRGDDCSVKCLGFDPVAGDMTTVCNGHGICDFNGGCACELGYIGDECQFECPVVDKNICSGHGKCEFAELSISPNSYDGFKNNCVYFADIHHCETYAILNNLKFINVAATKLVGENEVCLKITEDQCEKWSYFQDITYTYRGTVSNSNVPKGCYITNNDVYFNTYTLPSSIECGTSICVCQTKSPDTTYCSLNGDDIVVHIKGGEAYTKKKGLYEFTKGNSMDYNSAINNCSSCLAIQQDPPVSDNYYIIETSTSVRTSFNEGFHETLSECQSPVIIGTIPNSIGSDNVLKTCVGMCRLADGCVHFSQYIEATQTKCYKCEETSILLDYKILQQWNVDYIPKIIGDIELLSIGVNERLLTEAECKVLSEAKFVGSNWGYGNVHDTPSEPSGCLFTWQAGTSQKYIYYYNSATNGVNCGTLDQYGKPMYCVEKLLSKDECIDFAASIGAVDKIYLNTESDALPKGCIYFQDNRVFFNNKLSSATYCDSNKMCVIKSDYRVYTREECTDIANYMIGKGYINGPIQIIENNGYSKGCLRDSSNIYFNSPPNLNGATYSTSMKGIVKMSDDVTVAISGNNVNTISVEDCLEHAGIHYLGYTYVENTNMPSGCIYANDNDPYVYYNGLTSALNCGVSGYDCLQAKGKLLFTIDELISGEKYTRYVSNPESLCIPQSLLQVNSKIQAPVVKSLREYNDKCRYEKITDTCDINASLEECKRYSIDPTQTYKSIVRITDGVNDNSVSKAECKALSEAEFSYWSSGNEIAYDTVPSGCIWTWQVSGSVYIYYYNTPPYTTGVNCGTIDGDQKPMKCVQKSSGNIATESRTDRPSGCYMEQNEYKFNSGAGSSCSSTNKCRCKSLNYFDEKSKTCEASPIIKVTFTQDRTTSVEQTFSIDCQVITGNVVCAQCSCFSDYVYGHWSGMVCSTCAVGYGKSQCNDLCPDFDGENKKSMCTGYGRCLFGSEKLSLERIFQEANCICGQDEHYQPRIKATIPNADYDDVLLQYSWYEATTDGKTYEELAAELECSRYNDVSMASLDGYCYGIFKRDNVASTPFELHMGNTGVEFITYGLYYRKRLIPRNTLSYTIKERDLSTSIATTSILKCNDDLTIVKTGYDKCNHFDTNSKSCNLCEEGWTGKNCRAKCQKCLLRGTCSGVPDNDAIAKCICPIGTSGLWDHQCCPAGFRVTDLINWQSLPQSQIDQIKLQKLYDPYTTNDMDSAYFCKKCPGVFTEDWMQSVAAFKVCSGSTRGECVVESNTQSLVCDCKLNLLTGITWKGRACSCDDSIGTPYSDIASSAESTDYGCVIPTNGTAVCPTSSLSVSSFKWYPYMLYAIGRSIDGNYEIPTHEFKKYLGPVERLSSPLTWSGGIAAEIAVTTGPHGCSYKTPCHTGEGECSGDADCAEGLICNLRVGETINIPGYDPSRSAAGFKYCYDPTSNLIGCDPIPTFQSFDGTNNFYNYKYWTGSTFKEAGVNKYVPMTKDANGNLVIHKRDFPCPKGKYGVRWNDIPECALCPAGYYQDQTGQSTCKGPKTETHGTKDADACVSPNLGVIDKDHCTTCDAGYEPSADFKTCVACSNGKYESVTRTCQNCPENTYQDQGLSAQYGTDACKDCPVGTSTNNGVKYISTTGTCITCAVGKFNNAGKDCEGCVVGKFSHDSNAVATVEGFPDPLFTEVKCSAYAMREGVAYMTISSITSPAGCFQNSNNVYWNSATSSVKCSLTNMCVKKVQYVYATMGTYDPTVLETECKAWAGESYVEVSWNSWSDLPQGCFKHKTNGNWYFKTGPSGNNACDSHSDFKCVKRAKSGLWINELDGGLLINDYIKPLWIFTQDGTYDTTISESQCNELATYIMNADSYSTGNWADHPQGCFKHITSNTWHFKTGPNENNGCNSHDYYLCVKRIGDVPCDEQCVDYLYSSKSTVFGAKCRCSNTNYGAVANGGGVYVRQAEVFEGCTDCIVGTYQPEVSAKYCLYCPSGKVNDGQSSCSDCAAGKYQSGVKTCTDCVAGKYSDAGASSCTECPAGRAQYDAGKSSCTTCLAIDYKYSKKGATQCGTCGYCMKIIGTGLGTDCEIVNRYCANSYDCEYSHKKYNFVGPSLGSGPRVNNEDEQSYRSCFSMCTGNYPTTKYFQLTGGICYCYGAVVNSDNDGGFFTFSVGGWCDSSSSSSFIPYTYWRI